MSKIRLRSSPEFDPPPSRPPRPDGPVCTPTRLLLCQCASDCMSILMTDPLDNRSASTFYMYVLLLRFVVCTVRTVVIQDLDFWQIARIHISIIHFLIDSRPVNLHPLFLVWKHGSVCDPEKNKVQNMDLKKAWFKKLGHWCSKRPCCLFSFLNNNDPLFLHTAFFKFIFWTWFISKFQTLKNIKSTC
jgi:hypothetical protein